MLKFADVKSLCCYEVDSAAVSQFCFNPSVTTYVKDSQQLQERTIRNSYDMAVNSLLQYRNRFPNAKKVLEEVGDIKHLLPSVEVPNYSGNKEADKASLQEQYDKSKQFYNERLKPLSSLLTASRGFPVELQNTSLFCESLMPLGRFSRARVGESLQGHFKDFWKVEKDHRVNISEFCNRYCAWFEGTYTKM